MVAVQDCGLIIDLKTAEGSCYGALIMGISYALFEEKVMDKSTGLMLNPNMQSYRLAGYNDIPELVVHIDDRHGLRRARRDRPRRASSDFTRCRNLECRGQRHRSAGAIHSTYPDRVLTALGQKAGAVMKSL